jgi:hypothetical protein
MLCESELYVFTREVLFVHVFEFSDSIMKFVFKHSVTSVGGVALMEKAPLHDPSSWFFLTNLFYYLMKEKYVTTSSVYIRMACL